MDKRWSSQDHRRINELFIEADQLEGEARASFLDRACASEPEMRSAVERLLGLAEQTPEDFLLAGSGVRTTSGARQLEDGSSLGRYRIAGLLGGGGMGDVYRATDTRLDRDVALKTLPSGFGQDREGLLRFQREARALAALSHPNVVTVYSIEEADGVHFLTMELLKGRTLAEAVTEGGMPLQAFLDAAVTLAEALASAHTNDIVHRDIKPGNIMLAEDGELKLLDFGLAKISKEKRGGAGKSEQWQTRQGLFMGTPAYAAPEQVEGGEADPRSDMFSLGAVFYWMLTGRGPFEAESVPRTVAALFHEHPPPLSTVRNDIPPEVERIVQRCLAKDPGDRYEDGAELLAELEEISTATRETPRRPWKSPGFAVLVVLLVVALGFGANRLRRVQSIEHAHTELLPQIDELLSEHDYAAAFILAGRIATMLPGNERAAAAIQRTSVPLEANISPLGASVWVRDYLRQESEWIYVGDAPLRDARVPPGELRWRVWKQDYQNAEGMFNPWLDGLNVSLLRVEEGQPGMVEVTAGVYSETPPAVDVPAFWIDRYEVSNSDYLGFVQAGGYEDPKLWRHPFVKDGRELSWEETMASFVDQTGRQSPAGWILARPADGEENLPVGGVSWYEAAAYCEFQSKRLPTVFHWWRAAGLNTRSNILLLSNFGSDGPQQAGNHAGIGRWGTYDMAGNVQEWTWNGTGQRRYLLGGAWNQPEYVYLEPDARPPMDREPSFGVRCALSKEEFSEQLLGDLDVPRYDFNGQVPVDDEAYELLRGHYRYDPAAMEGELLEVDDSHPHWRVERVSYPAPTVDEPPMLANVLLPRGVQPPYQTVLYFPGSGPERISSSRNLVELPFAEFIPFSGRALVYPVYRGMYERGGGEETSPPGTAAFRDHRVLWAKEVSRTIDYLETRSDLDLDGLAFYGLSLGAHYGPLYGALDKRLKILILMGGGLHAGTQNFPPEIHPLNFAPRVEVPTLMITGRHDFIRRIETEQRPLFDSLGTPPEHKRFAILEGGHIPSDWNEVIRESLDWLDRYQGPVTRE